MATHKKQHWVPKSYLKAWCDPGTPEGQEPYVWVFPWTGGEGKKRAPGNIFTETDLYTISIPGGGRDLRLEHGLSQLESGFATLREKKLAHHEELDEREFLMLMAFVASCHARTPSQRDHWVKQLGEVLDLGRRLEAAVKATPPNERRKFATLPGKGPSMSMEQVEQLAKAPLQPTMMASIEAQLPYLLQMRVAVVEPESEGSFFLTSDAPCFFYDPKAQERPFMYRGVGLGHRSTEVYLPISPKQMLFLSWEGAEGYHVLKDIGVEHVNLMMRRYAKDVVVSSRGGTLSPLVPMDGTTPPNGHDDSTVV